MNMRRSEPPQAILFQIRGGRTELTLPTFTSHLLHTLYYYYYYYSPLHKNITSLAHRGQLLRKWLGHTPTTMSAGEVSDSRAFKTPSHVGKNRRFERRIYSGKNNSHFTRGTWKYEETQWYRHPSPLPPKKMEANHTFKML